MTTETNQLHVMFFPFMAHGHMIPTIDMAKLFASRGCKTTVVLTHANEPLFAKAIGKTRDLGFKIETVLVRFPALEAGLPEGCENSHSVTTRDLLSKFISATEMLQKPLEQLLEKYAPNCLVADIGFPWATESAAKFGIPRLLFHGANFFAFCVMASLIQYEPHKKVSSESEPFLVPNLPHEIKLTRDQIPFHVKEESSEFSSFGRKVMESEATSYGVIVNSFYELEPHYADHYRRVLGRKAWHIGPISFVNSDKEDKARRGPESSIGEHECLNWLNSKEPQSIVYVSFGSVAKINNKQLIQIATGLEASGVKFIWVVKKEKKKEEEEEEEEEEWLPRGFEERMEGKGLIIRGWAPQLMILEHRAVGGFVTHCGWNSVLEGVSAGLPMVTWPVAAEQFYNEKLVTDVLGIGVGVGAGKWERFEGDSEAVESGSVEKAVCRIMQGDEAAEMRSRAKVLSEMARKAFEDGGSSHSDLNALIGELRMIKSFT